MNDSILITIKKLLGIAEDYNEFDTDIIVHINSVLSVLTQLGVGPEDGFIVESNKEQWSDFIGNDNILQMVKSYIHLRVRLLFDPPSSSALIQAMQTEIKEYEWRLSITEPKA